MDLQANRAQGGTKWALARAGALALFLLTGVLLIASLNTEGILHSGASTGSAISPVQITDSTDRN